MQAYQQNIEIAVIGGGQAGLAMGYYLASAGKDFMIFDRSNRIGDCWRNRYDSLRLFSSRAYSALPGLALPGDPAGYPGKDELADYLERYAKQFRLPVRLNTKVQCLERSEAGFRLFLAGGETLYASTVIVASGGFQVPLRPKFAEALCPSFPQYTAQDYRNSGQVPAGKVLVVGDGATGRQIALDLVGSHEVFLATGRRRTVSFQKIFGKDIFWWLDKTGILWASKDSLVGRILRKIDPFPGKDLELGALRKQGIVLMESVIDGRDKTFSFLDGQNLVVDAVIWAMGYAPDTSWLKIPEALSEKGFIHRQGISPVRGLYYLGQSWQTCRGSALLSGVGRDAEAICKTLPQSRKQPVPSLRQAA